MSLFGNSQAVNLRSCAAMVEEVLAQLVHDVAASRMTGDPPSWIVTRGGAQVHVLLHARGEENFIRATAPIMHLEGRVDDRLLFRRLLELNAERLIGAAFALEGDHVLLAAERSTTDLDRSEVLDLVRRLEDYAVTFEVELVHEFGGRSAGISASPIFKKA